MNVQLSLQQEPLSYLLEEDDLQKRQTYYARASLSIKHVEALKAEVDQNKDQNEARAYLAGHRAFELAQFLGQLEGIALGSWAFAIGLSVKSEFDTAIKHFNLARRTYLSLNDKLKAAQVGLRQMQAHAMMGELNTALDLAEELKQVFKARACQKELAMLNNNMGILYTHHAEFAKAELTLQEAIGVYKDLGDHSGMALAYINLADVYQEQDRFAESRGHLDIAIAIARVAGQSKVEAGAMVNLALLHRKEGQLSEALKVLTQARAVYEELASPDKALAQLEEARVLLDLNLLKEAEQLAATLSDFYEQKFMAFEHLEVLTLLAEIWARTGRKSKALNTLKRVESAWQSSGSPLLAAHTRLSIISIEIEQSDDLQSLLDQLKSIKGQLEAKGLAATLALTLEAQVYLQLARLQNAQVTLHQAKRNALQLGIPQLVMRVLHLHGKLAYLSGQLEDAESYYKEAICYADSIRSSFAVDEFKLAFSSSHFHLYEDLMELLLKREHLEEAFEYLVKAKSNLFLHFMTQDISSAQLKPDAVAQRLQLALQKERRQLDEYLSKVDETRPSQELRYAILKSEQKLNELTRDLKNLAQKSSLLVPKVPSLAEIRSELDTETLLLEFYQSGDHLAVFVVSQQNVNQVVLTAQLSDLQADIGWLNFYFDRLALGEKFSSVYGEEKLNERSHYYLKRLYQHIFAPLEHLISRDIKKLIIVPHTHLSAVPMNALFDGERYLLDKYQIALYPSSSIVSLRTKTRKQTKSVLGFALAHSEIPKAQDEVRGLADQFEDMKIFLKEEASLQNWSRFHEQADIIHLATHGLFRPDNPMFSRLAFADGWLTARDLAHACLNHAFIFLSACESGLTGTQRQNEHLGLVRAFFHAGAKSLVTTLWSVKDANTSELVELFYENLLTGATVAEALQRAQKDLRQSYPNPYYWAAFQVNGNPDWTWS